MIKTSLFAVKKLKINTKRSFFSNFKSLLINEPSEQILKERRVLKFKPKFLYGVVADVESYKEFLPFCSYSRILSSETRSPEKSVEVAELGIGYEGLDFRYKSVVTKELPTNEDGVYTVAANAKPDENIEYIMTEWRFISRNNGTSCLVELDLKFKFRSLLAHKLLSGFAFQQMTKLMMNAFESRANNIK